MVVTVVAGVTAVSGGGGGTSGTVVQISSGNGLTGGPITSSGSLSVNNGDGLSFSGTALKQTDLTISSSNNSFNYSGHVINNIATITAISTTGSFTAYTFPPHTAGDYVYVNPTATSSAVVAATVGMAIHTGSAITGNGHNIGLIGLVDNLTPNTLAQVFGVEGRIQCTSGTMSVASAFVGAAQSVAEGASGSIPIYVDYQCNDMSTGFSHMVSRFCFINNDPGKIFKSKGIGYFSDTQQVIPRDRATVVTNRYYPTEGATAVFNSVALTRDVAYAVPFVCSEKTTWTKIGTSVSGAIAASVLRFGCYTDSGGIPTTRIADFGTVASTTTGNKEITISQSLDAGFYWLVVAMQGGASDGNTAWVQVNTWNTLGMPTSGTQEALYFVASTSAFAATFTAGTFAGTAFAPLVWLRK